MGKKKKFRKIVVYGKEYLWMFKDSEYPHVKIVGEKYNKDFLIREGLPITPGKVRELIEYGRLLSTQDRRRIKLEKIYEINLRES